MNRRSWSSLLEAGIGDGNRLRQSERTNKIASINDAIYFCYIRKRKMANRRRGLGVTLYVCPPRDIPYILAIAGAGRAAAQRARQGFLQANQRFVSPFHPGGRPAGRAEKSLAVALAVRDEIAIRPVAAAVSLYLIIEFATQRGRC